MDREVLKQIVIDQQEYKAPQNFFKRALADKMMEFVKDPSILILSGIRRSGKSTLQRLLQRELSPSEYYLNFDDERLIQFQVEHFQLLLEVLVELFGAGSIFYFDEIQNVKGWERFIRRLYEQGNKIYITGSNANLLSKELGTHLTGRYILFEVYPLSFKEIVSHHSPDLLEKKRFSTTDVGMIRHHFANYLKEGGIPEYVKYGKTEYLRDLLDGILYRDIIARYKLPDEKPLREIVYLLASNVGKEFSYSKLSKTVGTSSSNTISSYCDYLEQCYLFFFLHKYNHSLKKQIISNKKCYMIDTALIRITGFRTSEDRGRILENVVLLNLKRERKEVYFHKESKECDFIIREGNHITQAIQVTVSLSDEQVKNREVSGLVEAMEAYHLDTGLILTEYEEATLEVDNRTIHILPIWKWLLQSNT
ncbi:MAG: hypothetical protein S4CHLAM102_02430 [Chlamydiia bacterium]|nr:hypothetical protein [Chlamydiia bacterium]